jgi:hypothetical protein
MAKICLVEDCDRNVWGKGYCDFHQYLRTDKKKKALSRSPINKVSKKRKVTQIDYKTICDKIDSEAKANGTFDCFFCDKEIKGKADHHHLRGRDGNKYTDEELIVLAHNRCHVFEWHMMGINQLAELPWYESFKVRLKLKDEESYNKLIRKESVYLEK